MGGGRAAPRLTWQYAQKDGCAQRTGAHARPKPTSEYSIRLHPHSTYRGRGEISGSVSALSSDAHTTTLLSDGR